jgi:hypothetical protein
VPERITVPDHFGWNAEQGVGTWSAMLLLDATWPRPAASLASEMLGAAPPAAQARRSPRMLVVTSPSPQPSWTTHQAPI